VQAGSRAVIVITYYTILHSCLIKLIIGCAAKDIAYRIDINLFHGNISIYSKMTDHFSVLLKCQRSMK